MSMEFFFIIMAFVFGLSIGVILMYYLKSRVEKEKDKYIVQLKKQLKMFYKNQTD